MNFVEMLKNLWESTGLNHSYANGGFLWQNYVMIAVACVLLFVGIGLKKEPLLLVPISFGMLLINIPGAQEILMKTPENGEIGGFFYYITRGVKWVIFPPIIFLGIGAMTDFGPLIANPKSFILGAAAQLGIFITLFGAMLLGFEGFQAAAIAIIGGADGPTSIYVATKMGVSSGMLSAITVAAYSYMALIPIIQPPLMKLLTTKKERSIKMEQLRPVSKREKIVFPIVVTLVCGLILPDSLPLLGMLMFGNLLKECLVTDRLSDTASNSLMNIITIFLGISVGSMAVGTEFLALDTLKIVVLGLFAFIMGTVGGLLMGKLLCWLSHGKINPLIGSAGVSAVPMAARVSQTVAQKEDPNNYLLMHAMGPNVAGVIGSAVAAGVLLSIF
ncbi:MAG: sodium ion-translocating decarboxylase subunit beta [Clostridiales bacterium]|nr:sodium ion-translocating decarboxylase subunit beta [Clostridiales bacterium]